MEGSDLLLDFDEAEGEAEAVAEGEAQAGGKEGGGQAQGRRKRRGPVLIDENAQQWGDLFFNEHDL